MNHQFGAIILAAGKGKRMQLEAQNKVTLQVGEKPMISHIVHFMKRLGIEIVVVVVGHAKGSVMSVLEKEDVVFAEQKHQLGTGHAVAIAVKKFPSSVDNVLVVYGDDAVIYVEKHVPIITKLFKKHTTENAKITFLTIDKDNPVGLGRIIRDEHDNVTAIVEEKDATEEQKKIKEINPGCFIFSVDFLKKYLPKIKKSTVTHEYYLTSLIDLAILHKETVETVRGGELAWRGVNTKEELEEANRLFLQS